MIGFHPKTSKLSAQLLIDVQEGQLIVETAKSGSPDDVCALTLAKRMCAHRVKRPTAAGATAGPEWYEGDTDDSSTSVFVNSRNTDGGAPTPLRRGCRRTPLVSPRGR